MEEASIKDIRLHSGGLRHCHNHQRWHGENQGECCSWNHPYITWLEILTEVNFPDRRLLKLWCKSWLTLVHWTMASMTSAWHSWPYKSQERSVILTEEQRLALKKHKEAERDRIHAVANQRKQMMLKASHPRSCDSDILGMLVQFSARNVIYSSLWSISLINLKGQRWEFHRPSLEHCTVELVFRYGQHERGCSIVRTVWKWCENLAVWCADGSWTEEEKWQIDWCRDSSNAERGQVLFPMPTWGCDSCRRGAVITASSSVRLGAMVAPIAAIYGSPTILN